MLRKRFISQNEEKATAKKESRRKVFGFNQEWSGHDSI